MWGIASAFAELSAALRALTSRVCACSALDVSASGIVGMGHAYSLEQMVEWSTRASWPRAAQTEQML